MSDEKIELLQKQLIDVINDSMKQENKIKALEQLFEEWKNSFKVATISNQERIEKLEQEKLRQRIEALERRIKVYKYIDKLGGSHDAPSKDYADGFNEGYNQALLDLKKINDVTAKYKSFYQAYNKLNNSEKAEFNFWKKKIIEKEEK